MPQDAWDDYLDSINKQVVKQAEAYNKATATYYSKSAALSSGRPAGGSNEGSGASASDLDLAGGGSVIVAAARIKGSHKRRFIPALPTAPYILDHRPKLGRHLPIPACVD